MEQRPAETYIRVCRQRTPPEWAHAPLPFKLYRNCVRIPLSGATLASLSTEQDTQSTCSLGLLLHEMYGIIRMNFHSTLPQAVLPGEPPTLASFAFPSLGRIVASGGARFPGELYLLVNAGSDPAPGLYHYDPLHHTLDLLRPGYFLSVLFHALAQPPEKVPPYVLFYSSLFWKNACKYQEFSYRLQGLDIGCLLAQAQVVSERYGLRPMLHWRFLDDQLNWLLGFNPMKESIYAVMTLEEKTAEVAATSFSRQEAETLIANELPGTLEQYESLSRWPLLEAVHRASCMQTPEELRERRSVPCLSLPTSTSNLTICLPNVVSTTFRAREAERRSAWAWEFRARPLTLGHLALVLQAGWGGYHGDLDGDVPQLSHTLLYCIVNQVEGVPPGIYAYLPEQRLLQQIASGDRSRQFQGTQTDPLWNMAHVSLALIPVGNYALGFAAHGDRWYRMQNMEAGLCVQRVYLAAALNGLLCRSQLSYDDKRLDTLLTLPADYTSLIQILISPRDSGRPPHKGEMHWIRW